MDRRKELIQAYKQTPTPMGVYQVKNLRNNKVLIGSSMNVPGKINSLRFQLNANGHMNKQLQTDWNEQGADMFAFTVLETLSPEKIPETDWRKALAALEAKWQNEIQPYGEQGYNKEPGN